MTRRCHFCQRETTSAIGTGDLVCCTDTIRCNFYARRRLGVPMAVALTLQGNEKAARYRELAERTLQRHMAAAEWLTSEKRREMTAEYRSYLDSDEWRERRERFIREVDGQCSKCKKKWASQELQVHHLSYKNLGRERLGVDVVVLCLGCHLDAHGRNLFEKFQLDEA